jgi:hypothetical protein
MSENDMTIINNQTLIISTQQEVIAMLRRQVVQSTAINFYVLCTGSAQTAEARQACLSTFSAQLGNGK